MPIAALIVSILSALGNARNPDDAQIQSRNQLVSSIFGLMNNSSAKSFNSNKFDAIKSISTAKSFYNS